MSSKVILTNMGLRALFALVFIMMAINSATSTSGSFDFVKILFVCFAASNVVQLIRFFPLYRALKQKEDEK
ncbi:MAG: hypothetical protein Q4A67_06655 [Aerococcus sp.]|nr:hypothetical protein [Aerococcus sp.]